MVVNGNGEDITSGLVDDTETVALALDNVDDRPRDSGPAVETTAAIDSARVRNRNNSGRDIAVKERGGGLLPPITNLDDL